MARAGCEFRDFTPLARSHYFIKLMLILIHPLFGDVVFTGAILLCLSFVLLLMVDGWLQKRESRREKRLRALAAQRSANTLLLERRRTAPVSQKQYAPTTATATGNLAPGGLAFSVKK